MALRIRPTGNSGNEYAKKRVQNYCGRGVTPYRAAPPLIPTVVLKIVAEKLVRVPFGIFFFLLRVFSFFPPPPYHSFSLLIYLFIFIFAFPRS